MIRVTTAVESLSSLAVGTVESVAPDEIQVLLDTDAPRAIALNTGVPSAFPRVNGYILIPNEGGALVGLIVRLWIERSHLSKGHDASLINLPFPLRKLTVTPLGTLEWHREEDAQDYHAAFERGVSIFPSVGDPVLLPTTEELRAIVESGGAGRRVTIGTSPLLANSEIAVNPDRLFGGHLAVLGNTGSGKSCSVAGLVRWSIEAAERHRVSEGREPRPNARFIILDPNGEYRTTFEKLSGGARVFQIPPSELGVRPLTVPAWIWNSNEWSAFAAASTAIQRPLLQQALRSLRSGSSIDEPVERALRRRMGFILATLDEKLASGGAAYMEYGKAQGTGEFLKLLIEDTNHYVARVKKDVKGVLFELKEVTERICQDRFWTSPNGKSGYKLFSESDLLELRERVSAVIGLLPADLSVQGPSEDAPIRFDVTELADHLEQLASFNGSAQTASFAAGLIVRIRSMMADPRLSGVIAPSDPPSFSEWLEDYIGDDGAANGQVAVLDLSLVPADVIHIVIAVIGRVVFEALQRYRRAMTVELPTVLVLEEAHTFIPRAREDEGGTATAAQMCRSTFERIAREGRKFGLGLVISSQRPSEISATVLAQCNTFLLHRLVNDRDQDLVSRLVPDSLAGMFRELPTLPARHAILVGQATPLPLLLKLNELSKEHQPRSDSPRFWDTWIDKTYRPINWPAITEQWDGTTLGDT